MKHIWIWILGLWLVGGVPLWAQTFPKKSTKPKTTQVEKRKEKKRQTDRFRDQDRDGVNDRARKRHEERINRSFLKVLEEFLR